MIISFSSSIPETLYTICSTLNQANYECYLVGGAIRDLLLDLPPKDFDLATNATPDEIENLFEHTIPTGKDFGTITILIDSTPFEITTFRQKWSNPDGSRKGSMQFSKSLADDLAFRDFTINAMAYDLLAEKLIDPYHGFDDLTTKTLRPVGKAEDRFLEDALRMLRGVRLCAQKGLTMTTDLRKAIGIGANLIRKVSPERIADELNKLLTSSRSEEGIRNLYELKLLDEILPELAMLVEQNGELLEQICLGLEWDEFVLNQGIVTGKEEQDDQLCVNDQIRNLFDSPSSKEATFNIRLAILLWPAFQRLKDELDILSLLEKYRFSNAINKAVFALLKNCQAQVDSDYQLRQLLSKLGGLGLARCWARVKLATSVDKQDLSTYRNLLSRINSIYTNHFPLNIGDLVISGEDLIQSLEIKPGPILGQILSDLLMIVLEKPKLNQRETLLSFAEQIYMDLNT